MQGVERFSNYNLDSFGFTLSCSHFAKVTPPLGLGLFSTVLPSCNRCGL